MNEADKVKYNDVVGLYTNTQSGVDEHITMLFQAVNALMGQFTLTLTIALIIYVSLMGYSIISGYIVLTGREAVVRFSKLILIILLARFFGGYAGDLFKYVWDVPLGIAEKFAEHVTSVKAESGSFFPTLMDDHSRRATAIGQKYAEGHSKNQNIAIGTWAITMAPIVVMNIAIIIAKVISAVLFFISPLVFTISLLDIQNNYLIAWFKAILLTFLTVIIVTIVGAFVIEVARDHLDALIALPYDAENPISIAAFAPTGVMSIFGVVIVSQATTIASSLIGVAAINTQQATGFLQIAALQGASKIESPQGATATGGE